MGSFYEIMRERTRTYSRRIKMLNRICSSGRGPPEPLFYELDFNPAQGDENLIIDVIYDNLSPLRLQDLRRGTDIPRGIRFWPDWFDIPPYEEMHDIDGRRVYPRIPGIHTVQIRTGRRKFAQMGRIRDFSPENGGCTSPVFEIMIARKSYV
jgi:hypothetical protein